MTFSEFKASIQERLPPEGLSPLLVALWHDARGDWEAAHNVAQDIHTTHGSWIHAYLHRKEGDEGNAMYWYSKAGRKMPALSLEEEWAAIAEEILDEASNRN